MDDEMTTRVEQHIAEMTDAEFDRLVTRTRPPKPPADDAAAIRAAEKAGDWSAAFDLKTRRLNALMNPRRP